MRSKAAQRLKRKRGWTGLRIAEVFGRLERKLGSKSEYEGAYRLLSSRAHPDGSLGHLEVERSADGTLSVEFKKELDEDAAAVIARFARAHLEAAFWDAWQAAKGPVLQGPPVTFRLENT